jgi:hypothetical protein
MWQKQLEQLSRSSQAFAIARFVGDIQASLRVSDDREFVVSVHRRQRLLPTEAFGLAERLKTDPYVLVSCPYISPRVAEICERADLNYFDDAGNCRIRLPGCYVKIGGNPNPQPSTRDAPDLFAMRSSRILRVLIENAAQTWTVQTIAAEAKVSIGLASRICTVLSDDGFLLSASEGFRAHDLEKLVRLWGAGYRNRSERLDLYVMESDVERVERRMVEFCQRHSYGFALAEFSGAWQLAPAVKYSRASIAVELPSLDELREHVMAESEAQPAQSGFNMRFIAADPFDFYGAWAMSPYRVLSALQLYLQLCKNPARGEEAAEAIFRSKLRPRLETTQIASGARQ